MTVTGLVCSFCIDVLEKASKLTFERCAEDDTLVGNLEELAEEHSLRPVQQLWTL